MKKYFLAAAVFILSLPAANAQPAKFTGTWEGKLNVGIELRIVFHIKETEKDHLHAVADSPDQSAFGLRCDTTFVSGNELTIEMKDMGTRYTGRLTDEKTMEGIFTQGGEIPLTLQKVEKVAERKRPQTPKPPFPYQTEDLVYFNADKTIQYGATLTLPEGRGPFPAAVMITGSGPQDRDETILGHKPFAVMADHLARMGFATLRVDDRGVGKTTGDFSMATSAGFAKDVNSSLDYLLSRPEIDKKKTGLIGHSEGGMIAPMVAAKRKDIDFIILLAGPGVKITDFMAEQNEMILRSNGASKEVVRLIKPFFYRQVNALNSASDSGMALQNFIVMLEDWAAGRDEKILRELELENAEKRKTYAAKAVSQFLSPWFKYFLQFDPAPYLQQLRCKVLALNGEKDIQVASAQNLAGIAAALKKSKAISVEIKELPGLNHLFQTCTQCTTTEYGLLEETISPLALDVMSQWLIKAVK